MHRYTALVEDLLPEMCLCLKDKVRLVRENTLVLITRLIQEDYLKMRSSLLFHLLSALTDEDETIRAMTSSFFIDSALSKHKHLFQNHLLECLFYFNGYQVGLLVAILLTLAIDFAAKDEVICHPTRLCLIVVEDLVQIFSTVR